MKINDRLAVTRLENLRAAGSKINHTVKTTWVCDLTMTEDTS